ncbi:UDP-glucuronosyltransferase 2C1-like [Genypterus blacodes]|uniref:UDP-glucuronosyltransferase 2C1-like n=1 Tax=Genypterus blacodes TaxID=154954 RepID=UPI003F75D7AF
MQSFLLPAARLPVFLLFLVPLVDSGHVLVFPGEYSHWLNMRNIVEELANRNHSVTVLVSEASPSITRDHRHDARINFLFYQVPFSRAHAHGLMQNFTHFIMSEWHSASWLRRAAALADVSRGVVDLGLRQCESMLGNQQLMATLRAAAFDAVLLDPMVMCSDLVADVLHLPFIISLRFSIGGVLERHCGHAPWPPSYVPVAPLAYDDRMTFGERLVNALAYVWMSATSEVMYRLRIDGFYSEVKGSSSSWCETLGKADIWLIRTFWDLERPHPLPPNFKYVGGLHCKPANQLPEDMEAFVQSSGDAGVVVMTFGSVVTSMTSERADVIARGLGRLPQKVLWRYSGQTPKTLASNTKLFDWIPQNDLLGHPKTKAFVTHGGTNGLYEAVYHAVPLVGIPLFGDQPENLARLSRRGAAVVLDFNHMTSEDLTEALQAVISDPVYRSSMQRLSSLHRDRPVAPLDAAVFWVEFVMRNGGARHLRLASRDLNWFQYHSLDTAAALLSALLSAVALCWLSARCCLRRCRRRRREKSE